MSNNKPPPITSKVVEAVASDIKKNQPSLSSETAHRMAIESARRVDKQQREGK